MYAPASNSMNIPYRTRRLLGRIGLILLVVLVAAALVFFCWFTWLQRYVIYTRDGAVINMQLPPQIAQGQVAVPPEETETVSVYYNEGDNAISTSRALSQFAGYYADQAALEAGVDQVLAQAKALPTGTPIMLDVKSPKGNFFYSTSLSTNLNPDIDTKAMEDMIAALDKRGMYLIARLPALRDYFYGLSHTENGLFVSSGSHLWADDDYCYWLDPTKEGTISYLAQIVTELKNLGFDEVVFDEFRFPDSDDLKFSGDRTQAIAEAAKMLLDACAGETFALSFVGRADFPLPEGRSRLYFEDAVAAQAADIANQTGLAEPSVHLVFLTEVHDTRFDAYCVLRPLSAAH